MKSLKTKSVSLFLRSCGIPIQHVRETLATVASVARNSPTEKPPRKISAQPGYDSIRVRKNFRIDMGKKREKTAFLYEYKRSLLKKALFLYICCEIPVHYDFYQQ